MVNVSVIIPTLLSEPKLLAECLESLSKQTYQDFEVLVMINDTEGNVQEFQQMLSGFSKNVSFTALESNIGFTGAVNAGIKKSDGTYIALLNDDTRVDKNWINELLKKQQKTKAQMVASTIYLANEKTLDSKGFSFSWRGKAEAINDSELSFKNDHDYWLNKQNRSLLTGNDKNYWQEPFGPDAAACLYTRRLIDEIGLFNDNFFAYLEDVELALRARKAGYWCALAEYALVYHHKHASSQQQSGFKSRQDLKNWWRIVLGSYPKTAFGGFFLEIIIERARNIAGWIFSR